MSLASGDPWVLIERDAEFSSLSEFLAAEPADGCWVVQGEAGIGKSAVWAAACDAAARRGHQVLVCRSTESEAGFAYAGLGDLFQTVTTGILDSLPEPQRRALGAMLFLNDPDPGGLDQRLIGTAVLNLLRVLAGAGRVVVAVDDVQWLDAPSAAVLEFALRRLEPAPVQWLLAVRTEFGQRRDPPLVQAVPARRSTRVTPAGLSLDGVYALIRSVLKIPVSRPALRQIHRMSAGNPLYALELARASKTFSRHDEAEPTMLPALVEDVLDQRLGALPVVVQAALLAAALLTRPTVAGVAVGTGNPAREPLESAVQAGIITMAGDRLQFAHPLLAEGMRRRAEPGAVRRFHRRLATVGEVEERARHAALAAEGPDEYTAEALEQAGMHAEVRGAPETAVELYELATRFTPPDQDTARCRRIRLTAEQVLLSGEPEDARAMLESVLPSTPAGPERARILLLLAYVGTSSIEGDLALCAEAALAASDDLVAAGRAYAYQARCHLVDNDLAAAEASLRAALHQADGAGDRRLLVDVLSNLYGILDWTGRQDATLGDRMLALGDTGDIPSACDTPPFMLGVQLMLEDRMDEARAHLQQLLTQAAAFGDEESRAYLLHRLVELECRAGRWSRAQVLAHEQWQGCEQLGAAHAMGPANWIVGLVDAHLGLVDRARAHAMDAERICTSTGDRLHGAHSTALLGFIAVSVDAYQEAVRVLTPVARWHVDGGWREPTLVQFWANLIEAEIAVGNLDRAEAHLADYQARVQQYQRPFGLATAARCRGLLHAARGDLPAAFTAFADAVAVHQRMYGPFELGRTLLALGVVQRRAKRKRDARDSLRRALGIFEQLNARCWLDKTHEELGRIGGRAPSSAALTPTEEKVASLVATGKTNHEVAAALSLTVHTVEANLTRVYRKLGLRSRTELTVRLSAAGGQEP